VKPKFTCPNFDEAAKKAPPATTPGAEKK